MLEIVGALIVLFSPDPPRMPAADEPLSVRVTSAPPRQGKACECCPHCRCDDCPCHPRLPGDKSACPQCQDNSQQPGGGKMNNSAALYPGATVGELASKRWRRPRATVVGVVTVVKREKDGDWHIRIEGEHGFDTGKFIIAEIIPELPIAPPKVGDVILAQGIVRWDGMHQWAELHPLTAWQPKP